MKGLLLNNEYHMWQSAITGKKTQTRRNNESLAKINQNPDHYKYLHLYQPPKEKFEYAVFEGKKGEDLVIKPRYQVGEIVYLQEPTINLKDFVTDYDEIIRLYTDENGYSDIDTYNLLVVSALKKGAKWGNKMFMPESHARFYAQITAVKADRLNDTSNEDCIKEGIMQNTTTNQFYYTKNNQEIFFSNPKAAYLDLLKNVGKPLIVPNPWLFVYDFKMCKKP